MTHSQKHDTNQESLRFILYGLWRRQRSILVIAGVLLVLSVIAVVLSLFVSPDEPSERRLFLGLALGCLIIGTLVGAIALTICNPRRSRIYLLLKHKPEAIANVYFDIKYFRGHPSEYVVFQTQPPRRNYVISGIQRIGIPTALDTLRQYCPNTRFSCSPRVLQRYFSDPETSEYPPESSSGGLF